MIVAKIPADQQWFFIVAIPWFRNEIFSECIVGGRNRFETNAATITLSHLHGAAIIGLATSLIMNSHTYIIRSAIHISVRYNICTSEYSNILNTSVMIIYKV